MHEDAQKRYQALAARDPRFDGLFFVGVTSTGIYCRPICPAKTPKAANCRFFNSAEQAEGNGFRPCLRCRPELAPGHAPVDDAQRIARLIVQRLETGGIDAEAGLEVVAAQFDLSSRQIRRIVQKELGIAPMQLVLTRRLLLAKQLLTETHMTVTAIAYASGFSSLRRFNDAFLKRYGMAPSHLRRASARAVARETDTSVLHLSYRPPYDWKGVLAFLRGRALVGVEWVGDDFYARTVELDSHKGWIQVSASDKGTGLSVQFTHSLAPVLPALLQRLRSLFDLDARPDVIAAQLGADKKLKRLVAKNPGLRVPGAFSGFELGLRAILGQQVTVKAATTIAGRLVTVFGESYETPFPALNRLSPRPQKLAEAKVDSIAKLGIVSARARSIIALAQAELSGALTLETPAHHDPQEIAQRLQQIPGIGPWTAHYIAMRALRWPDAFPRGDVAILKNLGGVTAQQAEEMSQAWRPWRSYAVLHIWNAPLKP